MDVFNKLEKLAKSNKDFSAVSVVKEISRERFKNMPKEKRIGNKKLKSPKYKPNYHRDME